MKILVADKYPKSGIESLGSLGFEVVYEPDAKGDALVQLLASSAADVLVVRSSKVEKAALESGRLSLVVRAGAGYNTIDVKTASALGIYVSNCPGKNSVAVAELAFGLILALDRRIPENTSELKAGSWNKKEYSKARGVAGRTLGLIGVGSIGKEMIPRAKAFSLSVLARSRSLTAQKAEQLGIEYAASPEVVAAEADILSVHVALNADTRGLIGEKIFAALKPGSCFINTSRAEVVDQAALERAMKQKQIRAGLDVFAGEPEGGTASFKTPLADLPGFCGTHHIGASTDQAQDAISEEVTRIVRTFHETGRVPNVVNLCRRSPAKSILVIRHLDRVGVLAHVLNELKGQGINVQEMENIVFEGAQAAIARIHLDRDPPPENLEALRKSNENVLTVTLLPLH
ncbi:MAG: hydroxyacid dehydrogenase [Candidatus Wallbacteria bacterium]|nr:hydroxyacid dehydrogenase [Candidatus Wallbacteria bacterium]